MQEQCTAQQRSSKRKKVFVRCVISLLLLGYLLSRVDLPAIRDALARANPFWLLFSFLLHIIGFLLTAYRWQLLLAARDAHFSILTLIQSYIIGVFFNNFLPSTVGGDLFRAYDTAAGVGSKTEAMTVVVVERLTGMFALGLFALLALVLGFSHFGSIPIIWSAIGGLGLAFVFFVAAMNPRTAEVVKHLFRHAEIRNSPFLRNAQAKLKQIYDALCVYKRNTRVMAIAYAAALLLQVNVILHYYFISHAMGLPVPMMYFFLIIPAVTVMLMLPMFINGIGGREAAYILLLGEFGVSSAEAIAFSWIAFAMILVQGIAGGLVYALRKK
ncbi:hypothetical protein CSB45_12355 [candidate division KSB3 bacterium]|uniref:TIGR00374 family protein n=1 Tax=candidate division KSB3 bacterium TaxID=2044937 RepID=A0A2G6E256_9BACT|nr:MAG: hypothetical protein CSB45_12355 [candidate division KSB3 bacterium]PIE28688.1 MAG: hypothetical protein CSA57_12335 [candidate division KSB3 bacterium]